MLELIRERRYRDMNVLGIRSPTTNPMTFQERGPISAEERELRKIAYRLLILFTEGGNYATPSVNTATVADRFSALLTSKKRNTQCQTPGVLTGRHFRALLRSIANPPARTGKEDGTEMWILKPQFVPIAKQIMNLSPVLLNREMFNS